MVRKPISMMCTLAFVALFVVVFFGSWATMEAHRSRVGDGNDDNIVIVVSSNIRYAM